MKSIEAGDISNIKLRIRNLVYLSRLLIGDFSIITNNYNLCASMNKGAREMTFKNVHELIGFITKKEPIRKITKEIKSDKTPQK